jgi:zinc and cadmium transporter
MTLVWIVSATIAGGILSVGLAATFALTVRATWVPMLISFAIGALLGAAFLEVVPHAFERLDAHTAALTILAGIFVFFILEKLVLWRHCHTEDCEAHDQPVAEHDHGKRSGTLILIGDSVHNFIDGVLIAAAFLESTQLGVVTAIAIVAHEIPQEVGDFLILLHSGYTKSRALVLNLLASLASVVGGVLGYFALQALESAVPFLLGIVAASMIYVAVADLIPGLHKRTELRSTVSQALLIAMGVASIALVRLAIGEGH